MKYGKRAMLWGMLSMMIGMSLALSGVLSAQEPEYIRGVGGITNEDGSLDRAASIRQAFDDLNEKVFEYCGYKDSTFISQKNKKGGKQHRSELLPREEIELIPMEGYWVARIEKAKVDRIVSKRKKGKFPAHAGSAATERSE